MDGNFPYTNPYISQQQQPVPPPNPYMNARQHQHQPHRDDGQHDVQSPPLQQQRKVSQVSSLDGIIQRLVSDPFDKDLVHTLEQCVRQQTSSTWTWSSTALFVTWSQAVVVKLLDKESCSSDQKSVCLSCLALLAHVLDESWSDEQVYASMYHVGSNSNVNSSSSDPCTLLHAMEQAWLTLHHDPKNTSHEYSAISSALLVAWTAALASLYRLQHVYLQAPSVVTAPSPFAVIFAVDLLTKEDAITQDKEQQSFSTERVLTACVEALRLHMTAHEIHSLDDFEDLPSTTVSKLVRNLQTFASKLVSTSDKMAADQVRLGIASLHLLIVMQQANSNVSEQALQNLVEMELVVPWGSEKQQQYSRRSQPRWTSTSNRWSKVALPLLTDLCRIEQSSEKIESMICTIVGQDAISTWMQFGTLDMVNEPNMASLVFALRFCRVSTRCQLPEALPQTTEFIATLLQQVRQQKSLQSAILLHALFQDRQSIATHDELSRRIWRSINAQWVAKCLDTVLSIQSDLFTTNQPVAFLLLDTVAVTLSCDAALVHSLLGSIPTQSVESLIELTLASSDQIDLSIRDNNVDKSMSFEWGENTPPANNLSRIDDFDVTFQPQPVKQPLHVLSVGLESSLAMAAATTLACLACCDKFGALDGRAVLLQGRMMEAVSAYMERLLDQEVEATQAMTRRQLFLTSMIATTETLDYLATVVHTNDVSRRQMLATLKFDNQRNEAAIDAYRASEKRLTRENAALQQNLLAQSVDYQRQLGHAKSKAGQHAKQLIEVHQAERHNAERRADEMAVRLNELEDRLQVAEEAARVSKLAEAALHSELVDATSQLQQLEKKKQNASQRADASAKRVLDLSKELQTAKTSIDAMMRNDLQMKAELQAQKESLAELDESENEMRDSLEALFGDLVNLSKLYELKEQEQSTAQRSGDAMITKLQKKIDAERNRSAELEERLKLTEADNEHLSQKYARVREKLDNEREARVKEKQSTSRQLNDSRKHNDSTRNENASYLNYLDRSKPSGKSRHRSSALNIRVNDR
ncbi:hypothetical protein MPSEU_000356400 [Mayamaea pseudoterrestris]|nr:hypothetical protein MPSEU_000356400 [Mayamaea pseudoterrestris]